MEGGAGSGWSFFFLLSSFFIIIFFVLSLSFCRCVCAAALSWWSRQKSPREREREVNWMSTERGQSALSSAPVHTRPSTVHSLSATTFFIRNISRVSAISFSFSIYRDRQQIDCLPTNENVLFLKISTRRVTCITFAVWTNQDDPDVSAKFVGNTKSSKEKKKRGDVRSPITPLDQGKRKYKKKFLLFILARYRFAQRILIRRRHGDDLPLNPLWQRHGAPLKIPNKSPVYTTTTRNRRL